MADGSREKPFSHLRIKWQLAMNPYRLKFCSRLTYCLFHFLLFAIECLFFLIYFQRSRRYSMRNIGRKSFSAIQARFLVLFYLSQLNCRAAFFRRLILTELFIQCSKKYYALNENFFLFIFIYNKQKKILIYLEQFYFSKLFE